MKLPNKLSASGCALLTLMSTNVYAMGNDDPLVTTVQLNQLEWTEANSNELVVWDISLSAGWDLHKGWLNADGEIHEGDTEARELSLGYSMAISPHWDLLLGVRRDSPPQNYPVSNRNWLQFGAAGMAPYFVDTELAFYIGDHQRSAVRLSMEKELMLSQRWQLVPEWEINAYGHNDEAAGQGSGLSDMEIGLRLYYVPVREFTPYIGWEWERLFGHSAHFARDEGEKRSNSRWLIGISAWY